MAAQPTTRPDYDGPTNYWGLLEEAAVHHDPSCRPINWPETQLRRMKVYSTAVYALTQDQKKIDDAQPAKGI